MKKAQPLLLTEVPRAVAASTGVNVSYRSVYAAVVDGTIPAHRVNGRWRVEVASIAAIPGLLGREKA